MKRPEILEVRIHDLSRGGSGVARLSSGQAVFVPGTLPGERVKAEVTRAEKRYLMARLLEILERSPHRVEPPCPVFGRCGGCQWQHAPYSLQWETKVQGLRHEFAKRGWELNPAHWTEMPAERPWEYRNRVQLKAEGGRLGFFAPQSHEFVAVDRCAIARPELNAVWDEVRLEAEKLFQGKPSQVELEIVKVGEGQWKVLKSWNARHAAQGFRQVNEEQNDRLREWIARQFAREGILLDLYGGHGNFSELLVGRMREVHCVDIGAPRDPSARNGLFFHRQAVLSWLAEWERPADFAILDPPRDGLGADRAGILNALERLGVARAILIGCYLDAWLKDLEGFFARGWKLEKAAAADFFPQTTHLESVALLGRSSI